MIAYSKELVRFRPRQTMFLFVLLFFGAASEGVGLLALVPMIELLGVSGEPGEFGAGRLAAVAGAKLARLLQTDQARCRSSCMALPGLPGPGFGPPSASHRGARVKIHRLNLVAKVRVLIRTCYPT